MAASGASRGPAATRWRYRRLIGGTHPGLAPLPFAALAILLGAAAGVGALVFRVLIAAVHNLAFLGRLSTEYDANVHTPASTWGVMVVLVPAVGALFVVFLIRRFAPEAKGHGVPEVMDAIYYNKSEIRPIVAVIKSLGSAISIGTGGSVGREGPIVQIGAALGSAGGRLAGVSRWQRATLVAAGGGAGIAATFNTPIGGVLFAAEVLLHEISARTLVPVALATTTATYVGRYLFGDRPAFSVPTIAATDSFVTLPGYLLLGCVTAFASVLFIRSLYGTEDFLERVVPGRPYLRHVLGMLAVGVVFTTLFRTSGHYWVQGVGYAAIVDLLSAPPGLAFLVVLFALKLFVTSCTLGSGASGGIFSPSLFMGATLGAAFATVVGAGPGASAVVFVLAGMAGMVAGTTGAVLTAIVMLFEMTLNYGVVLPMALTASVSYGLRRLILADSIYTMKLTRRGHVMPQALQANAALVHHVSDLALARVRVLPSDEALDRLDPGDPETDPMHTVVVDGPRIVGVVSGEGIRAGPSALPPGSSAGALADTRFVTIRADDTLFHLLTRLQGAHAPVAVVVGPEPEDPEALPHILGVVTRAELVEALAEGMEVFED
jgi:CIC family chloride channel protein